eukprot:TRINITY_DN2640_c0_g1_i1.p3 TRINITY_DN2640_c0_g1~~TRINITY_DN2640_c0_g1_i1.p3  ORF type:complete len:180 (+),score=8.18 TRINITY_DN2640_c0_g1_i1:24-542(+)
MATNMSLENGSYYSTIDLNGPQPTARADWSVAAKAALMGAALVMGWSLGAALATGSAGAATTLRSTTLDVGVSQGRRRAGGGPRGQRDRGAAVPCGGRGPGAPRPLARRNQPWGQGADHPDSGLHSQGGEDGVQAGAATGRAGGVEVAGRHRDPRGVHLRGQRGRGRRGHFP